jgi:hypothetical protein
MVIVPVYAAFGCIVKLVEAVLIGPPLGPLSVKSGMGVCTSGPSRLGVPVPEMEYVPLLRGLVAELATSTVITKEPEAPAARVPRLQVTVPVLPTAGWVQLEPVVEMKVVPVGRVAATCTLLIAELDVLL